ncbi:AAA family ATPase (plasmid) [Trichlorobacter lovleyi]|uniref:DnaB-like helicase C-terminal domain-containing protein n=1 Tax=Trichlorobacter lovleyi TaxID=313985 RepID=UPI00223EFCC0|nr:DnaB-like helicase C-terminal domain-containing protein [Trichlorobacter lovleyi]QOX80858.1 AAA family ATPase [Trichlorobacter lovleyi]
MKDQKNTEDDSKAASNIKSHIRDAFGLLQERYSSRLTPAEIEASRKAAGLPPRDPAQEPEKIVYPTHSSGFRDIDIMMGSGFEGGQLILVGGYTAAGKTALVSSIVMNTIAKGDALPILFFQKKHRPTDLAIRFISSHAKINLGRMFSGRFLDYDWPHLQRTAATLHRANINIYSGNHGGLIDISEIEDEIAHFKSENDMGLVVVDSLQDFCSHITSAEEKHLAHTSMCYRLKALAAKHDVPVLLTSSINSTIEKRNTYDKRPSIGDLVGVAGNAADIADAVLFIHRPAMFCPHCIARDGSCTAMHDRLAEIVIAKQNNGPTGIVELSFYGAHLGFETAEEE